jgi:protein-disulfide isomerase
VLRNELVVVNIFSDFQCPVCSRAADPIKQLAIDFPGKVRVVFRNNPLKMHGRAHAAAMAAAAAGRQNKFWQYHDRLFGNQRGLDDASLRVIAENLGLNLEKWEYDRTDPELDERITEESESVVKLGAPGTPGIFVNGWRSLGWGSYQGLKGTVQREIASGEKLIAAGTPRSEIPAARIRETALLNPKTPSEGPIDPELWVQVLTAD